MENSTKETIMDLLKDIRKQNPNEIIFLLIDNFSSHKAEDVKNGNYKLLTAKDLFKSIELSKEDYKKASNGVKLTLDTNEDIVLLTYQGKDICLYKKDENVYKMYIMFA